MYKTAAQSSPEIKAVPHLTTALSGPLHKIERSLLDAQIEIESWFRHQWRLTPAPFYASVDIRNAGFKIAPVDTNLFPSGFNNLNSAFTPLCIQAVQQAVERFPGAVDRILLVPEDHTRNHSYLRHLAALRRILEQAGFKLRLGSLRPELKEPQRLEVGQHGSLLLEPIKRCGARVGLADFDPDLVLLNNDLASGRPVILEGIEQHVSPAPGLGWSDRSKSVYFRHYRTVVGEFAEAIGLDDPWLLEPLFYDCGEIDFMKREGEACLQARVADLLGELFVKYRRYRIEAEPFLVLKADTGTYGMGVMTVRSPEEAIGLNRRQRTRMSTVKGGQKVRRVLIQEGIFTRETWGGAQNVAEPVVYTIDHNVVGGFYRVHARRGPEENLNAPGMQFQPLAFSEDCLGARSEQSAAKNTNRFYSYGVVGRLAVLAAGREASMSAPGTSPVSGGLLGG